MGVSASKVSEPFAISSAANTELDRLSFIASRFLSSSDLYDIENIVKPGTCGNYSVFMRKGIETTLLPFVVDLEGNKVEEVLYQDPRKAIESLEVRKKFCKQLTSTMIRVIATVTAALASIQVIKNHNREAIAAVQRGGVYNDIRDVADWLAKAGYITNPSSAIANTPIDFHIPGQTANSEIRLKLTLLKSAGNVSHARFSVEPVDKRVHLTTGSLRAHFLYKIDLPGTGTSVLPIHVVDDADRTWMAGVLINDKFKSFLNKTPPTYITQLLEYLLLSASGKSVPEKYIETREESLAAWKVFDSLQKSNNNINVVLNSLNQYFTQNVPGYQQIVTAPMAYPGAAPAYPGAYPGAYVPPAAYAQPGPYVPPTAYGYQPQQQQQQPVFTFQKQGGPEQGLGVVLRQPTSDGTYDIPTNTAIYIRKVFESFRKLIVSQSCPAEERAAALFGAGYDAKNFIRTGVCADPYWRKSSLAEVHPWMSFQFLSIMDWDKPINTPENYAQSWKDFVNKLAELYNKGTNQQYLTRQPNSYNLDQMRFVNIDKFIRCDPAAMIANPAVAVQGIQELRTLYEKHNARMWKILNELVIRVKHPETNKDIIRLHPNVLGRNVSSAKYVDARARLVQEALAEHYIEVERLYTGVVQSDQFIKR